MKIELINQFLLKQKRPILLVFLLFVIIYYVILLERLIWFPVPFTILLLIKRLIYACFFSIGFIISLLGCLEKFRKTRLILFLFSSLILVVSSFWYSFTVLPITFIGINFLLFYLVFINKVQNEKSLYT